MRRVAVFCGSQVGHDPVHAEAARELGRELLRRGTGLVYGGGNVGLMGVIADAVLSGGGEVIGVIPGKLAKRELAHEGCTELHVVDTMHERKALMAEASDGFIALPGGVGTLEEMTEVFTWQQLGYHRKPCGLLDVDGFWQPFAALLEHFVSQGFLAATLAARMLVAPDPASMLDALEAWVPPVDEKWSGRAVEI